MAIQRISTAHSERLNPDQYWPQWDEDGYIEAANSQAANAQKAFQSGEAVAVQASGVVSQTMEGQTADAAMARFASDGAKLENRGGVHMNNATINGLMAQNVANRKASINFLLASHEADVEAIKTTAVAQGWTQNELQDAVASADDGYRQQIETVATNSDQAHEELKGQLNTGEAPSAPASMPGGVPGEGSPTLDGLDPEVEKAVSSAMGTGGGMGDMSQMAGMASGLLSPLTGALQSPPGADMLNQAGQQGFQMGQQALQALLGQGGGAAELTPDQAEELIAGQGGDSTDGLPGGHDPGGDKAASDEGPKFEYPDRPETTAADTKTDTAKADAEAADTKTEPASAAPSPAAEPVSAAPPTSAMHPTTELSGDSNSAPAPATNLSGAGAAPMGGTATLGAPGMGAAGGFAGAPAGGAAGGFGAPMMSGAPMMGGAAPQAAAPARGAAPVATATSADQRISAATLSAPVTDPRTDANATSPQTGSAVAAVPVTAGASRVADRHVVQVRRVMAHLLGEYRRVGLAGDLAIGALEDSTMVYSTWDGLGFLPHGVRLPANVIPLAEFPLSPLFRQDFVTYAPGALIAVAAELQLIPEVSVIFTTNGEDVGIPVTAADLRGLTLPNATIERTSLKTLPVEEHENAAKLTAMVWELKELPDMATITADLRGVRGTAYAVRVLAAYLLADAARFEGTAEAGYALQQALWLPSPLDEQQPV